MHEDVIESRVRCALFSALSIRERTDVVDWFWMCVSRNHESQDGSKSGAVMKSSRTCDAAYTNIAML
jgi:hypothetical protein